MKLTSLIGLFPRFMKVDGEWRLCCSCLQVRHGVRVIAFGTCHPYCGGRSATQVCLSHPFFHNPSKLIRDWWASFCVFAILLPGLSRHLFTASWHIHTEAWQSFKHSYHLLPIQKLWVLSTKKPGSCPGVIRSLDFYLTLKLVWLECLLTLIDNS